MVIIYVKFHLSSVPIDVDHSYSSKGLQLFSSKITIRNISKMFCIASDEVHVRTFVCKNANDEYEERERNVIKTFSGNFSGMYCCSFRFSVFHVFSIRTVC
jgi:hypothetical protein